MALTPYGTGVPKYHPAPRRASNSNAGAAAGLAVLWGLKLPSVLSDGGARWPSTTHFCALRAFAYLFGSGFGWDLESFLFLDSFLESFFVSASAAGA